MRQPILVIAGPTASGKTALAIDIAKSYDGSLLNTFISQYLQEMASTRTYSLRKETADSNSHTAPNDQSVLTGGEVISADSRQVYKGFDITTCKATLEEMRGVPHHLMSFVSPTQTYTVSDFKRDADNAIEDILMRGKLPIIAGGTGFYIDAVLYDNMFAEVPPNPALRAELKQFPESELFERINTLDPERALTIDPNNKVRLIRALEIIDALGVVPKSNNRTPRYNAEVVILSRPKEELRVRIRARIEERLDAMLAEINSARVMLTPEIAARLGFDFTLCLNHLDALLSRDELIERLTAADWQLAKRQERWFKTHNN